MINRSEEGGEKNPVCEKDWTWSDLSCFHKHITHFWGNKSVTLNKHTFIQSEFEIMDFWLGSFRMGIIRSQPQTRQCGGFWYFLLCWWEELLGAFLADESYWHSIYTEKINSDCVVSISPTRDLCCKHPLHLISNLFYFCFVFLRATMGGKKWFFLFFSGFFSLSHSLQVKLSRLCEQDKILQELEARIRTLKEDKVCTLNR